MARGMGGLPMKFCGLVELLLFSRFGFEGSGLADVARVEN